METERGGSRGIPAGEASRVGASHLPSWCSSRLAGPIGSTHGPHRSSGNGGAWSTVPGSAAETQREGAELLAATSWSSPRAHAGWPQVWVRWHPAHLYVLRARRLAAPDPSP